MPPAPSPYLFIVDVINEGPLKATFKENSSEKNRKHNVKLIKTSKLAPKALLQNKSIFPPKVSKNCFIVKNKYLIATRSCFVPVTMIRDKVDIKDNSMKQNSGKQVSHSLPKYESKHLLNWWYFA